LRYEFTGAAKFQRKLEKYFAEPTKDEWMCLNRIPFLIYKA
jgi:hypothetical protein